MDLPDPSGHRWALPQLQPPALWQLEAAHRVGLDPADLVKRWYDACVEAERQDTDKLIAVAAGDEAVLLELLDLYGAACQAFYRGLSEAGLLDLTRKAARIVNPDATSAELRDAHLAIRNGAPVRDQVRKVALQARPRRAPTAPATAPRPRQRRAAASSSTSSADPGGDDPPGEPPPRWVTLWAHPDIRGGHS